MKNTVVAIGAQRRAEPQGLKPESFCSFIAGLKACASTVGLRFHGWQSLSLATTRSRLRVDVEVGGADRDRTGGLLVANQALSQLSYSPFSSFKFRVSSFEQIVKLSAAHSKPET